jgi:nicotinamide-nucleotide amidase
MYDEKIIDAIRDQMVKKQQTIAVAESVTSGHLQVALGSAINASTFFQGGITAYNLGQKTKHLNVEPIHAVSCNCVSPLIANQMALQVSKMFMSDWGIGITGYSAPMPEYSIEELFAYYAIAYKDEILSSKKIIAKKEDPMSVQFFYVNHVLRECNSLLIKG